MSPALRPVRSILASLAASASVVLLVSGASAQDAKVEAAAKALQKKAIQSDYLGTDFAKAKAKLEKAIADCGADKCGAPLRAQLQRDLGTVLVGGAVDVPAGIKAFAEALKIDPKIELDPDLKTSDIEKAFEKAKAGGAAAAGGGEEGDKPASAGDFTHAPFAVQAIRTPLPIYVEYNGSEALTRVIARYRAPGMGEWKTLELKKVGNGWGAEMACLDMQPGFVSYYLQGFNADNDPVASGGDRNTPFKTEVKQSIEGDKPHLPGQNPPAQCPDTGDCPPGFPGCKGAGADGLLKAEDVPCEEDSECKSNKCDAGKCTAVETQGKYKKVWIGGELMADVVFLPGASNVCSLDEKTSLPASGKNYYCVDDNGKDFPLRSEDDPTGAQNRSIDPEKGNSINGGPAFSKFRILASLDYAATQYLLVGARLGVALPVGYSGVEAKTDGQKTAAPWLHLEARATFVLGKDGLAAVKTVRPYVYGAFGLGTYDAKVSGVKVRLLNTDGTKAEDKDLSAYKVQGQAPLFFGVGVGARYAISDRAALMGGIRGTLGFGNGVLPAIAPDLAVQFGF